MLRVYVEELLEVGMLEDVVNSKTLLQESVQSGSTLFKECLLSIITTSLWRQCRYKTHNFACQVLDELNNMLTRVLSIHKCGAPRRQRRCA